MATEVYSHVAPTGTKMVESPLFGLPSKPFCICLAYRSLDVNSQNVNPFHFVDMFSTTQRYIMVGGKR